MLTLGNKLWFAFFATGFVFATYLVIKEEPHSPRMSFSECESKGGVLIKSYGSRYVCVKLEVIK